MDQNNKSYKIVTEDIHSKIMMNYPNGSLKIKRNIISKKLQSQNNNLPNKKKDLWQLMQEFLKRSCKPKLERK